MHSVVHDKAHRPTLARKPVKPSSGHLGHSPQVQNLLRSYRLQANLKVGAPHDKYEQEADRVADQVMRQPEPQVQRT